MAFAAVNNWCEEEDRRIAKNGVVEAARNIGRRVREWESGKFVQHSRRQKGGERNIQYESEERNRKAADESRITVAQRAKKDVEGERKEGTRWDSECGHPMCPIYHARTTSAVVVPRTAHCERFPRGARNSTAL